MADLTEEQMLEMARVAGLRIPDEDVAHLTIRLNALLEASEVLDLYPLGELKALPSLPHPFVPFRQREARPALPQTVETDAPLAYKHPHRHRAGSKAIGGAQLPHHHPTAE